MTSAWQAHVPRLPEAKGKHQSWQTEGRCLGADVDHKASGHWCISRGMSRLAPLKDNAEKTNPHSQKLGQTYCGA